MDQAEEVPDPKDQITESDDDQDSSPVCNFCTFAVTGAVTEFQPIFVCNECFNENESNQQTPLCLCQACASICHGGDDHDVEYIGMGVSYCDCDHVGNCTIYQDSLKEAERLGVSKSKVMSNESKDSPDSHNSPFLHDVYQIPTLNDSEPVSLLVAQAKELIKFTKDTHWIERNTNLDEMCALERLAWGIYQHHLIQYGESLPIELENGGAEWWVQVKEMSGTNTAIDLHYDKDEALAESFALGSFPTLSTVTYLTPSSSNAAPTLVFDHTYSQGEEEVIDTMLCSRPSLGKHLVFDGTLLHGAPSNPLLKSQMEDMADLPSPGIRVTFLVNVWKDRRPSSVHSLDSNIRQQLLALDDKRFSLESPLSMTKKETTNIAIETEEDLPELLRQRIELPFVAKGITWEEQLALSNDYEDDDNGGLVVVTFPPPQTHDTILITFGPGLQAYLDYLEEADEDNETRRSEEKVDYYI